MNGLPTPADIGARAAKLDALLVSLQGELDAAANPHRRALARLGVNLEGWTARPYDDAAFDIWSGLLARDGEDVDSRHHLAIMHHARAIELEQGTQPQQSDADWNAALQHWAALWRSDAFWDRIAAIVCPPQAGGRVRREPVDALRKRLPTLLLRLHLDVAFDPGTAHHRARHHIGLVLGSALPEADKCEARRAAYEKLAAGIPDTAWDEATRDEETIGVAVAIVQACLNIDPDNEAALMDALRFQHRMLRVQINQLNALDDRQGAERQAILRGMQQAVASWLPYFVPLCERAASIAEPAARRDLGQWFRIAGDVCVALEEPAAAIGHFERGAVAAPEADEEGLRCRRELPRCHAQIALLEARRRSDTALAGAHRVRERDDLTVPALQVLANAYLLLGEHEAAAACAAGLALEPGDEFDFAIEQDEAARTQLQELAQFVTRQRDQQRAHELYVQAQALFGESRHAEATTLLDECVTLGPDTNAFHYLRARCHVALLELDEAEVDLREYRRTMADTDEDRDCERLVDGELREAQEQLARLGRESLRLRRQALPHANRHEYEPAVALLRRAIAASAPQGQGELQTELSAVLAGWAVAQANTTLGDESLGPAGRRDRLIECRDRLAQARELDAGNDHAAQNLAAVDQAIEALRPDIELADMLGAAAFERVCGMRKHVGAGELSDARALYRQALACCRPEGQSALQHEWAEALTGSAVAAVNAAHEKTPSGDAGRLAAYRRALAELQEANEAEPASARVRQNLDTLLELLTNALRSEAAAAYNKHRFAAAEEHLREALANCPQTLRKATAAELSIVLANRAVAEVNEMVSLLSLR
ncbi:MAG: hypothetical protein AB7F93_09825 [Immundisolibacter sp.]|uniref:hypothetical protein n=1 Tax=Immundisolibacter sp. TaxID=1934948 RepID=UPI003D0F89D2